jgi:outer membrane protein assembly factor BamB
MFLMRFRSLLALSIFPAINISAIDWPAYGGLERSHVSYEKGLRTDWREEEPQILWSLEVGLGYSSVAEVDGKAYTQGYSNGKNTLFCVDATTGKVLWKHQYPCEKAPKYFQGGSRGTPSISEGVLYLNSHQGDFYALDAENGKILWTKNLLKDFEGIRPDWGFSGSPLCVSGKVIFETGSEKGSLVALDAKNGELVWRAGNDEAGYSSPMMRTGVKDEILVFNQYGLLAHHLSDGRELKRYQHKTRFGINAAQPMDLGTSVLISSAYGKGAALVDLKRSRPRALWESAFFSCQMASLVRLGDFAYGIQGQTGGREDQAKLFCLEIEKGKKRWEKKGFGLGTVILIEDNLVILSDRGEITLAKANHLKFQELARFQVLSGKQNWTPPTYANGRMHCRSSLGKWVCLQMGISRTDGSRSPDENSD